jgi:hypothetical protein
LLIVGLDIFHQVGVVKNDIVKLFDTIKSYSKFLAFLIDDENLQQKSFRRCT